MGFRFRGKGKPISLFRKERKVNASTGEKTEELVEHSLPDKEKEVKKRQKATKKSPSKK